jgi:hypothetical protein
VPAKHFSRACFTVVFLAILFGVSPVALAQSDQRCKNQTPELDQAFSTLAWIVGAEVGQPVECARTDLLTGDLLQQTTTGLFYQRAKTTVPVFTDGNTHWALVGSQPIEWSGNTPEPPLNLGPQLNPSISNGVLISAIAVFLTMLLVLTVRFYKRRTNSHAFATEPATIILTVTSSDGSITKQEIQLSPSNMSSVDQFIERWQEARNNAVSVELEAGLVTRLI